MNTGVKIAAFAAALAATFGTAYGVGTAADPVVAKEEKPRHAAEHGKEKESAADGHAGHGTEEGAGTPAADGTPGGLQVSDKGYTFALRTPTFAAGSRTEIAFSIRDGSGRAVTAYEKEHGKELHLIVASRDLTEYRHLHPVRAADGTWSVPVTLPKAGGYRAFADFTPSGAGKENVTLGADLAVSGAYAPAAPPAPAPTARVDGYEVRLGGDPLRPGKPSTLRLTVSKGGRPVSDLQPYLGAYGHLVALRSGDLAYLHVHPNDGGPGPEVAFGATAPSPGTYRLFLDFQHEGKVRTAAFTVHAH
ncbi:hypothetical protein [Streptomyces sp. NPDC050504]|uniref:hypothetical protein n=1 Tax=Streptomyces sp. NPDC050504 TaxID=3365618 RepID=UPI00379EC9F5